MNAACTLTFQKKKKESPPGFQAIVTATQQKNGAGHTSLIIPAQVRNSKSRRTSPPPPRDPDTHPPTRASSKCSTPLANKPCISSPAVERQAVVEAVAQPPGANAGRQIALARALHVLDGDPRAVGGMKLDGYPRPALGGFGFLAALPGASVGGSAWRGTGAVRLRWMVRLMREHLPLGGGAWHSGVRCGGGRGRRGG